MRLDRRGSRPVTPLEMMLRLRGRSHLGAMKARCSGSGFDASLEFLTG
jgi:hypothetical protein